MKPGVYSMTNEQYHGDRTAVSKSGLDLIHRSPAHFRWAQENKRPETDAMVKGSLVHLLALEPDKFDDEYVQMPTDIKVKRGKAWDEFSAQNQDKIILSATQLSDAKLIAETVMANPVAASIIEQAVAIEESVFAEDMKTGVMCKCRPDIRIDGALYDLKTSRNAAAGSFAASVRSFRYHVQSAYYTDLCNLHDLDIERFGFIVVDTDWMPYQCTVFHSLETEAVELGRAEYRENLDRYSECLETNDWPGYPDEYDYLALAGYGYDGE